jgi:hypothetical protein
LDRWDRFRQNTITEAAFDTNGDQKPDQWQYFNSTEKLERVAYDTNHDGKADYWEFLDKEGKVVRLEKDRNFDGKPDFIQKP